MTVKKIKLKENNKNNKITVTRAEIILVKKSNPLFEYFDDLSIKSLEFYNYANFTVRQIFFRINDWIRYNELNKYLKNDKRYKNLPSQTSQQILKLLDKNWKSFFKSIKDFAKNKSKYLGKPKPPKYKNKNGRFIILFTNQQCKIKNNYLQFPKTKLKLKVRNIKNIKMVRIIPLGGVYRVEIIYEKEIKQLKNVDKSKRIISIDLGLENFVTIGNNIGKRPIIVKGKILKSINQYYNKKRQKLLSKSKNVITKRIHRLTLKRNNKIKNFMHIISKQIIKYCLQNKIDTIVIGYNKNWKQKINISKKNNQNFVSIPFNLFLMMLKYKQEEKQIKIKLVDESYTSGCSFLDNEIPNKKNYKKNRRICRGLFKTNTNKLINQDINAQYNILRKAFPDIKIDGIEGVVFRPLNLKFIS